MHKALLLTISVMTIANANVPGFGNSKKKTEANTEQTSKAELANTSHDGEQLHQPYPKEVVHTEEQQNDIAVIHNIQDESPKLLETKGRKSGDGNFTGTQKEELKQLISDHIRSNPELIEAAIEVLEQKREAEQAKLIKDQHNKIQQQVDKNKEALLDISTSSVYGNKKGSKIMVVFYDDNCPYCRNFGRLIPDFIAADKELKVLMRPWAFLSAESKEVAAVLLAAAKQDKFGELYAQIVKHSGKIGKKTALELSKKAGLDVTQLEDDLKSHDNYSEIIRQNSKLAHDNGFMGTPTILLGDSKQLRLVDLASFTPEKFKKSISNIGVASN